MNHLDENEIRRFVHNLAPIPEQIKINRHLVNCPECAEKVQGRNYLREYPEEIMNSFNLGGMAALQQEEYIRGKLEKSLAKAQDVSPKAMLQQCLNAFRQQTGLVFQAFQNSAAKLTMISKLKASEKYSFLPLPYDYARGYVPNRDGDLEDNPTFKKLSAEADQNLIQGDFPGVEAVLQRILTLDPNLYRSFREIIIQNNEKIGFIESDAVERRMGVYLYAKAPEAVTYSLVALIPGQKDEEPLIQPLVFSRVGDQDYYLVMFEDLPGRNYIVIVA